MISLFHPGHLSKQIQSEKYFQNMVKPMVGWCTSSLVPSLFLLLFPSLFCSFSLLLCLCMPHDKDTTVSNIGLSPKS